MATQLSRIEQNTLTIIEMVKQLTALTGRRFDELNDKLDTCHVETLLRLDNIDAKLCEIESKLDGPSPEGETAMEVTVGEPVSKE